jgi:curved DNA-binding protein CbpA
MGSPEGLFGHCDPWADAHSGTTIGAMTSGDPLRDPASALVEAAQAFYRAAESRGSHSAATESLASLQEALQVLSAAWYRLAADSPRGRGDLTREQEVRLTGALHDVAAAFARCARACREGHSAVTPVLARMQGRRGADGSPDELSWFMSSRPPTKRVA